MSSYFLNAEDYGVVNALLFRTGWSHINEGYHCVHWQGRVYHLILGMSQILPVVGQIIALAEAILYSQLNKPLELPHFKPSTHPKSEFFWPSDAFLSNTFGLTATEKANIQQHLTEALKVKDSEITFNKYNFSYLTLSEESSLTSRVNFISPVKIRVVKTDKEDQILLISNNILSKGGQRRIRTVINLSTGDLLVKKRMVTPLESKIYLHQTKHRRFCCPETPIIVKEPLNKPSASKTDVIMYETLKEGSLATILFSNPAFNDFSPRFRIIMDLSSELFQMHSSVVRSESLNYNIAHFDIKTDNILLSQNLRAELSDFGYAGMLEHLCYSPLATPPDYLMFFLKNYPLGLSHISNDPNIYGLVVNLNKTYGLKKDIWSLGLVFASVIFKIKYLNCITSNFNAFGSYPDLNVINLSQKEVDYELDQRGMNLLLHTSHLHHNQINSSVAVIKKMLRVKPEERISAKEAFQLLSFIPLVT